MHAARMPDHARAPARQIVDPFESGDADRPRVEQQQIGPVAGRDAPAAGNPVLGRRIRGQPAHAFFEREGLSLAHPVAEKVQPEARVAEENQVRAGVRQRDHAGLVPEQRRDARVVVLVELGDEARLEPLGERAVEKEIERVGTRARRDRAAVRKLDLGPVAEKQDRGFRPRQVLAKARAKRRIGVDRGKVTALRLLHSIEGVVRVKQIGILQREVERQRLAAGMDTDLVAARTRLRATLVVAQRLVRVGRIVHREHGHHEGRPTAARRDRLHDFGRRARAGRHHVDAAPGGAELVDQREQLFVRGDGRRHRPSSPAAVVG